MEIKVVLLLVSALVAVAAAYPYKDQQQATAAGCNYNSRFEAYFNGQKFTLIVCTISKHVWIWHHAS